MRHQTSDLDVRRILHVIGILKRISDFFSTILCGARREYSSLDTVRIPSTVVTEVKPSFWDFLSRPIHE